MAGEKTTITNHELKACALLSMLILGEEACEHMKTELTEAIAAAVETFIDAHLVEESPLVTQ